MFTIAFPFKIMEDSLSWFSMQVPKFEKALALLDVDGLHLCFILKVWPVGRDDLE